MYMYRFISRFIHVMVRVGQSKVGYDIVLSWRVFYLCSRDIELVGIHLNDTSRGVATPVVFPP